MQTIFYNARIETINEKEPLAEAMLVNDGSIVFVGKNDEILNLKQKDTKLIDLKNKLVIPALFDINLCLYKMIDDKLKNAKNVKTDQNNAKNDADYEKFANFDNYKTEFLKLQDRLIKLGITTICELCITRDEFVFWKKLAEANLLKIDVIGYVDMLSSKAVMDDNCRSYRKYKNHFRLGGYSLALDGDVLSSKAWLKRPYKNSKGYVGYSEIFTEQLYYLIKTALEEKKQLFVSATGDRAVEEFLDIFENVVSENKIEDNYRPVIINAGLISKQSLNKMKNLCVTASFDFIDKKENKKLYAKSLGLLRAKKYQPIKLLKSKNLEFLLQSKSTEINNAKKIASKIIMDKNTDLSAKEILKSLTLNSAIIAFDGEQKGSLESGKYANFLVLDGSMEDIDAIKLSAVYQKGEKI